MKTWQKDLVGLTNPLLKKLEPDHGIAHAEKVFKWCLMFAESYPKADKEALFAASYLHDLGHLKLENGQENHMGRHSYFSLDLAKPLLLESGAPREKQALINKIIEMHEEKDLLKKRAPIEALIFYDADKIEVLGAMGLIRQFIYSGRVNKKIWDPDIPINRALPWGGNFSAMHTILGSLMHFEFYTKKSKEIAIKRKQFMQLFIEKFFKEWDFKE